MLSNNVCICVFKIIEAISGGSRVSLGGGGVPTRRWGVATYDFAKISQKLHEIERIWMTGGGGWERTPLAPP